MAQVAEPMSALEPSGGIAEAPGPSTDAPQVRFKITYGRQTVEVTRPLDSTVLELKLDIEKSHEIPPALQKVMLKGPLRDDQTLREAGLRNNSKLMLIASRPADVLTTNQPSTGVPWLVWDVDPEPAEAVCRQSQHKRVLDKGVPDDAIPGIAGRQVPLRDDQLFIPGLLNSQGTKVRLTFKDNAQPAPQLWLGSATTTQQVPYPSVAKIEAWPITGQEEYSIVSLHVGSRGRLWLYFLPSQYVAGIKIRVLGLESLL